MIDITKNHRYTEHDDRDDPNARPPETQRTDDAPSHLLWLLPPRAEVNIVEWIQSVDPATGLSLCMPRERRASISCFVPMRIFHAMLAGRERVLRLKKLAEAGETGIDDNSGDYLVWVVDMTLAVWQLTEPGMEREAFECGLGMDQIMELFELFFGEQMRRFAERSRFQRAQRNQS